MGDGLAGKRALVTGAASGIGKATAERLEREGAQVAAVDVMTPDWPLAITADVSDEPQVEAIFIAAVDALGGLDVVVANAAVQFPDRDARADRLDLEIWQRTLETNLTGAFLTAKHGLKAMLENGGGGSLVCVGSVAGHFGIAPGLDAYSASKSGVAGLVRVLAADYAREGIRVNGVLPGITDTPMNDWWRHDPEQRADAEQRIPLGRIGTPEEIAAVIAFLASDDASYVTGALWTVDGGLTA